MRVRDPVVNVSDGLLEARTLSSNGELSDIPSVPFGDDIAASVDLDLVDDVLAFCSMSEATVLRGHRNEPFWLGLGLGQSASVLSVHRCGFFVVWRTRSSVKVAASGREDWQCCGVRRCGVRSR